MSGFLDIKLVSGRRVDIYFRDYTSVAGVRHALGDVLGLPGDCLKLINAVGNEYRDEASVDMMREGSTTVIVVNDRLENRFACACRVPEFSALLKRRSLHVVGRRLLAVPESLGELVALKELHLGENWLASVPQSLGQLVALRRLDLGNNQLASVPESLGQLVALKELLLDGNQLASVPESLGQLKAGGCSVRCDFNV